MIDTQHVTPLQKKTQKPRVKLAYDDPTLYITRCVTVAIITFTCELYPITEEDIGIIPAVIERIHNTYYIFMQMNIRICHK